ncbi:YhcN/YlaJ family sporulation lipoprotein [Paenibacillus cymbidii]|uniref:YhcN/YlaJ family sporulation lipoprotein n=1 Tax=Paenibacillus cymbidii TaxID=1639034 RepID=UPI001081A560|nr:YhcN/YlaJ family sporulation lipoprotein [Paenibacillus cymbidii]
MKTSSTSLAAAAFVLLVLALPVAGCGKERANGATEIGSDHVRQMRNDMPPGGYVALSTPNGILPDSASPSTATANPMGSVVGSIDNNRRLADAIVAMGGVSAATVLTMGNNAYVAVILTHQGRSGDGAMQPAEAGDAQKNDIAKTIRQHDPSIKDVYVSANPDVVRRIQDVSTAVGSGRPIAGLIEQLSTAVSRIVPMRAGAVNPLPPGQAVK